MVIYKFDNCQEIEKFAMLINVGYYESKNKIDILSADPDA